MARPITVNIGGRERPLFYRLTKERRAIEAHFKGKHLKTILHQDVLGLSEDASRNGGSDTENFFDRGSVEALAVCLFQGLKHEDPKLTQQQVDDWLDEYVAEGGLIAVLGLQIQRAMYLQGIFGLSIDLEELARLDAEAKRKAAAAAGAGEPVPERSVGPEAGKDSSSSSTAPSTSSNTN